MRKTAFPLVLFTIGACSDPPPPQGVREVGTRSLEFDQNANDASTSRDSGDLEDASSDPALKLIVLGEVFEAGYS